MKAVTSLGPLLEAVQSALLASLRSNRPASVNEIGFANLQGGMRIRVKFSEVIERSRMSDDESLSGYTATRGASLSLKTSCAVREVMRCLDLPFALDSTELVHMVCVPYTPVRVLVQHKLSEPVCTEWHRKATWVVVCELTQAHHPYSFFEVVTCLTKTPEDLSEELRRHQQDFVEARSRQVSSADTTMVLSYGELRLNKRFNLVGDNP